MQISDIYNQISQQLNQQLLKAANGGKMPETTTGGISAKGLQSLLGLEKGQIFEGTVTKMDGGKVTISLANGTSLNARMEDGVSLTKGVATFFQVKSNVEGQIALKAVSQDSFSNPTLLKALNTASLPITDRNLSLVSEMMKNQLPIDAGSLGKMARVAYAFPDTKVETLVQLEKMKLPVTQQNIEQLEHYNQGEGKVQSNLESLMKALPQMVAEGSIKDALNFNQKLLEIFQPEQSVGMEEAEGSSEGRNAFGIEDFSTVKGGGEEQAVRSGQSVESPRAEGGTEIAGNTGKPEAALASSEEVRPVPEGVSEENEVARQTENGAVKSQETLKGGEIAAAEDFSVENEKNNTGALNVSEKLPVKEEDASRPLRGDGAVQAAEKEGTEKPAELLKNIAQKDSSAFDQLKELTRLLSEKEFSPKELKQLFTSDNYRNLLERVMEEQWFLKPEEMENKEKLKQLYQRMDSQMEKLQNLLEGNGKGNSPVNQQIADTRGNLSFMNEVHQMYNYVQIPLKMANQNATGDLYVYTNKKALQKNKEDISAHLHLEMEHLGTTDVFVRLRGKNLSTNFMLADEKALDLVISHVDILTKRLSDKGFDVDVQVKEKEEETTEKEFVEELLGQEMPKEAVSRYSFDVKV